MQQWTKLKMWNAVEQPGIDAHGSHLLQYYILESVCVARVVCFVAVLQVVW